ncbi:hypothetical protein NL676_025143 [Syzygium grande]|nr:hypothetical protein NL676_025143 [Syzygium grande]
MSVPRGKAYVALPARSAKSNHFSFVSLSPGSRHVPREPHTGFSFLPVIQHIDTPFRIRRRHCVRAIASRSISLAYPALARLESRAGMDDYGVGGKPSGVGAGGPAVTS